MLITHLFHVPDVLVALLRKWFHRKRAKHESLLQSLETSIEVDGFYQFGFFVKLENLILRQKLKNVFPVSQKFLSLNSRLGI